MIQINACDEGDGQYAAEVSSKPGLHVEMEAVYFTLVAIALYVFCDWVLKRMEVFAGRQFEHRTLIFFALLLGLALVSFALIRNLAGA